VGEVKLGDLTEDQKEQLLRSEVRYGSWSVTPTFINNLVVTPGVTRLPIFNTKKIGNLVASTEDTFLLKKNRLDQEKEILVEASKLIDKTIHEFNSLRTGTLNPISLKNYETYLKKIKRDKKNQEGIVSEWHRLTERAKDNFVEGRKEKKVLEKLKEKKLEIYRLEKIKEEQKFIDELSNSMYNNRRNSYEEREKRS
jgi:flagellar FliJ protein